MAVHSSVRNACDMLAGEHNYYLEEEYHKFLEAAGEVGNLPPIVRRFDDIRLSGSFGNRCRFFDIATITDKSTLWARLLCNCDEDTELAVRAVQVVIPEAEVLVHNSRVFTVRISQESLIKDKKKLKKIEKAGAKHLEALKKIRDKGRSKIQRLFRDSVGSVEESSSDGKVLQQFLDSVENSFLHRVDTIVDMFPSLEEQRPKTRATVVTVKKAATPAPQPTVADRDVIVRSVRRTRT